MATYRASDFWDEWERVTRLLNSTRIAIQTEIEKWDGIPPEQKQNDKVTLEKRGRRYTLSVQEHIDALSDESLFSAMVLQYSCGALEDHGRARFASLVQSGTIVLSRLSTYKPNISLDEIVTDYFKQVPVEAWGNAIISAYGLSWQNVEGNKQGITEVFTLRNAIAHGEDRINQTMLNRVNSSGGTCTWQPGDPIAMNFDVLQEYRARLRSFGRVINGD